MPMPSRWWVWALPALILVLLWMNWPHAASARLAPSQAPASPTSPATSDRFLLSQDGSATEDGPGVLRINASLLDLFDAVIEAAPDRLNKPALLQQIASALAAQPLSPASRQRGADLFGRYVDYRAGLARVHAPAMGDVTTPQSLLVSLQSTLRQRDQIRTLYFSPLEIAGLFGAADALDTARLQQMQLQQDPHLSDAERKARLAGVIASLPAAVQHARQQASLQITALEQTAALRAAGASADEIYRQRAADYGEAAAQRMAQLDTEQAQWSARLIGYQAFQQQLAAETNPDKRAQADADYVSAHFSATEAKRLTGALALLPAR